MVMSKKHLYMLYSLMQVLKKVNTQFQDKPLEASISKIGFIKMMKKAKVTEKSIRGLYKNLEALEKKKYLKYDNKMLSMTKKGLRQAEKTEKETAPYVDLMLNLEKIKAKSIQTHFKAAALKI